MNKLLNLLISFAYRIEEKRCNRIMKSIEAHASQWEFPSEEDRKIAIFYIHYGMTMKKYILKSYKKSKIK